MKKFKDLIGLWGKGITDHIGESFESMMNQYKEPRPRRFHLIVTGSPHLSPDTKFFNDIVHAAFPEIAAGRAGLVLLNTGTSGVPWAAKMWAREYGHEVRNCVSNYRAGYDNADEVRDLKMLSMADGLLVLWDGKDAECKRILDIACNRGSSGGTCSCR